MALTTLNTFTAEIAAGGNFARQYNYKVHFVGPKALSSAGGEFSLSNPTEKMMMRCESIAFPGQNIETSPDTIRVGPLRSHAFGVNYGPINAIFLCDAKLSERRYFENWHRHIFQTGTFKVGYYDEYVTNMTIEQYNDSDELTYQIVLKEVFPKNITEMPLSTAAGELHRMSVELVYHHWVPKQVVGGERLLGMRSTASRDARSLAGRP